VKMSTKTMKDGRVWIYGHGTYEEVKALNIQKDFNTALDVLNHIKKSHNRYFGGNAGYGVDKTIYGKRKAN